MCKAS